MGGGEGCARVVEVGWLDGEVVWEMRPVLGRDRKYCW